MTTPQSIFRLNAEDKAHLKNIRESMNLKTNTDAVRMALKKLSALVDQVSAYKQREQGL
jgi:hypothetical protein